MAPHRARRNPGLTARRRAVLEIVAGAGGHPDARRVFHEAQARFPGISLATVYRALAWLRSTGLVAEVRGEGASRFDANLAAHHHLVCASCGRIADVEVPLNGVKEQALRQSSFATVSSVRVELRGLCAQCAAAARAPSRGPREAEA